MKKSTLLLLSVLMATMSWAQTYSVGQDLTSLIKNTTFENDASWKTSKTGGYLFMNNVLEMYGVRDGIAYQYISLPAGSYRLSCQGYYQHGSVAYSGKSDASTFGTDAWEDNARLFVVSGTYNAASDQFSSDRRWSTPLMPRLYPRSMAGYYVGKSENYANGWETSDQQCEVEGKLVWAPTCSQGADVWFQKGFYKFISTGNRRYNVVDFDLKTACTVCIGVEKNNLVADDRLVVDNFKLICRDPFYNDEQKGDISYKGDLTWDYNTKDKSLMIRALGGTAGLMPDYKMGEGGPWPKDIESVYIRYGVKNIGEYAFYGFPNLVSVMALEMDNVGVGAFDATPWWNNLSDGLVYIGSVAYRYKGVMPANYQVMFDNDKTTGIADYCFSNASTNIGEINLPPFLRYIGTHAFSRNTAIKTLSIPKKVTTIGDEAFYKFENLESVTILGSPEILGDPFTGCSKLNAVYINSTDPKTLPSTAFADISETCRLFVPAGTRDAYIAAGWTEEVFKGGVKINYGPTNTYLKAQTIQAYRNQEVVVPIEMMNVDPVGSYSFTVDLPKSLKLVGLENGVRSSEVEISTVYHAVKGTVKKPYDKLITGTKGTLVYLKLKTTENTPYGDVTFKLKNIHIYVNDHGEVTEVETPDLAVTVNIGHTQPVTWREGQDVTYLIKNPNLKEEEKDVWIEDNAKGTFYPNGGYEGFCKPLSSFYQEVDLPAGKYRLDVQGYYANYYYDYVEELKAYGTSNWKENATVYVSEEKYDEARGEYMTTDYHVMTHLMPRVVPQSTEQIFDWNQHPTGSPEVDTSDNQVSKDGETYYVPYLKPGPKAWFECGYYGPNGMKDRYGKPYNTLSFQLIKPSRVMICFVKDEDPDLTTDFVALDNMKLYYEGGGIAPEVTEDQPLDYTFLINNPWFCNTEYEPVWDEDYQQWRYNSETFKNSEWGNVENDKKGTDVGDGPNYPPLADQVVITKYTNSDDGMWHYSQEDGVVGSFKPYFNDGYTCVEVSATDVPENELALYEITQRISNVPNGYYLLKAWAQSDEKIKVVDDGEEGKSSAMIGLMGGTYTTSDWSTPSSWSEQDPSLWRDLETGLVKVEDHDDLYIYGIGMLSNVALTNFRLYYLGEDVDLFARLNRSYKEANEACWHLYEGDFDHVDSLLDLVPNKRFDLSVKDYNKYNAIVIQAMNYIHEAMSWYKLMPQESWFTSLCSDQTLVQPGIDVVVNYSADSKSTYHGVADINLRWVKYKYLFQDIENLGDNADGYYVKAFLNTLYPKLRTTFATQEELDGYMEKLQIAIAEDAKMGDVNGDGSVTVTDALAVVYKVLDKAVHGFDSGYADMDRSGDITITDALTIVKKVLKGSGSAASAKLRDDDEEQGADELDPQ